jgi:hypothetical protein
MIQYTQPRGESQYERDEGGGTREEVETLRRGNAEMLKRGNPRRVILNHVLNAVKNLSGISE